MEKKAKKENFMKKCMEHMNWESGKGSGKGLIWFPLTPIIFGLILFITGWFLNPEITRVLWLIVSGLIVSIGAMMWIMGSLMFRAMKKNNEVNSAVASEG